MVAQYSNKSLLSPELHFPGNALGPLLSINPYIDLFATEQKRVKKFFFLLFLEQKEWFLSEIDVLNCDFLLLMVDAL